MMVVCFHHLPGRGKPIEPNEKQTRGPAERVSSTYLDISYMICFSTGCFTRTNSSGNRTSPLYSTCQHKHAKPVMVCLRNQPRLYKPPPKCPPPQNRTNCQDRQKTMATHSKMLMAILVASAYACWLSFQKHSFATILWVLSTTELRCFLLAETPAVSCSHASGRVSITCLPGTF